MSSRSAVVAIGAVLAGLTAYAQPQAPLTPPAQPAFNEALVQAFTYRNTGPFRMQARMTAIAVPSNPAKAYLNIFYTAPWIGGVFKTTNNGTTFESLFDGQANLSIGAIALAPSAPDTVWVGAGDAFTSRSSYAGDGIYKSTDAGRTWRNMGLADSHHIARIASHPTNPDIVYVATMEHLYSTGGERGVYKTTDGGARWERVLSINDRVGVIDLVMHPTSEVYRTDNGGQTWTKMNATTI